jgi:3-deoxy-7-phosphoheptulonate synthase
MVIVMNENATENQIQAVIARLVELSFNVHRSTGVNQTVLGAIGDKRGVDLRLFELMDGVHEVVRVTEPYKLASRAFHPTNTIIRFGNVEIGGTAVAVMAGPCAVESEQQLTAVAMRVKQAGAAFLRGGAFKPRSSPYSFQGLGEAALKILRRVGDREGLLVVSEVMEVNQVSLVAEYVDLLQVGARNMQNFNLLRELGKIRKPVLLKRGLAATIEETLMAAEYIMAGGNSQVVLCERGIRTFENATRNTLDISAIPVVKKLSHLPIIADPSHGTGRRDKVAPMARAAIAAGADGLLIEVHHDPDNALSDGAQSIYPDQFDALMKELRLIAGVIGRSL